METPQQRDHRLFSIRERCTVISPDRESVYSFDLEGRPVSWFRRGRVYKRSLASEVHVRERSGGRRRRWKLEPEEAGRAFAAMLSRISARPAPGNDPRAAERLAQILRWTPDGLLRERERFRLAYRPVQILPPDQYLAIVLQASFGCSWNRCSFCNFYADQPFRIRGAREFRDHCRAVQELLGRGVSLRKRIFLASGNALVLPDRQLLPLMRSAREFFPHRPLSAFVDVFTGERRQAGAWSVLRDEGLEQVHVGLETGHDSLLARLGKPGSAGASKELVRTLKQAGLQVSVILLVGVGGRRYAVEHVSRTLALMERLPLEPGDRVYLSPFVEPPESAHARRVTREALERQYAELRDGIRSVHGEVTVSRYDIREFVY